MPPLRRRVLWSTVAPPMVVAAVIPMMLAVVSLGLAWVSMSADFVGVLHRIGNCQAVATSAGDCIGTIRRQCACRSAGGGKRQGGDIYGYAVGRRSYRPWTMLWTASASPVAVTIDRGTGFRGKGVYGQRVRGRYRPIPLLGRGLRRQPHRHRYQPKHRRHSESRPSH